MTATLYIVGTGPGDPELLTLKAVEIIRKCSVIVSPRGTKNGTSTALGIIAQAVPLQQKECVELHFPMKKIRMGKEPDPEVLVAWRHAAEIVLSHLKQGRDVCFPTLGDPAIYSTGYYLFETICGISGDVAVEFIPGISAMSSCSASLATPLCLGDEMVAVVPATFSDQRLKEILATFDTIVLMKVHRVLDRITNLLRDCQLLEHSVLIERAGLDGESFHKDIETITEQPHYYSTILIRKNPCMARVLIN